MLENEEKILKEKLRSIKELREGNTILIYPKLTEAQIIDAKIKMAECYDLCKEILKYYCDIPEEYYDLLPLWIIGTYIHDDFETFPLLFVNATKGSGKSRLLRLIIEMSKNGKMVSDLKESVLFRTAKGCTIGIDEFESVAAKEQGTLRTLLNAAYKKGNAVERMRKVNTREGEKFEVERFDLYTPLVMANIWGVEEVLQDRCLTIILEKSNNPTITKLIENFTGNPKITQLKRTSCSLCSVVSPQNINNWNTYITTLTTYNTYNTLTTLTTPTIDSEELKIYEKINAIGLNGRNLELFFPLFLIAKAIDENIFDNTLKIAKKITEEKENEEFAESKDISLLDYVSKQEFYKHEFVPINNILREFKMFTSIDEEEIKWMNSKWIGRALKRMKLIVQKRRKEKGIEVILDIDKAKRDILHFKVSTKQTPEEATALDPKA